LTSIRLKQREIFLCLIAKVTLWHCQSVNLGHFEIKKIDIISYTIKKNLPRKLHKQALWLQHVDVAAPSYGANAVISAAQGAAATIHGYSW